MKALSLISPHIILLTLFLVSCAEPPGKQLTEVQKLMELNSDHKGNENYREGSLLLKSAEEEIKNQIRKSLYFQD